MHNSAVARTRFQVHDFSWPHSSIDHAKWHTYCWYRMACVICLWNCIYTITPSATASCMSLPSITASCVSTTTTMSRLVARNRLTTRHQANMAGRTSQRRARMHTKPIEQHHTHHCTSYYLSARYSDSQRLHTIDTARTTPDQGQYASH